MDPRIWGPHTWFFLHTLTFSYPDQPGEDDKRKMYTFFTNLADILPCSVCKIHYKENIEKYPINTFLNSRKDLIKYAKKRSKSESIVVTLSGRGDKDVEVVEEYLKKNVKNKK